jgi:hypothetical protein
VKLSKKGINNSIKLGEAPIMSGKSINAKKKKGFIQDSSYFNLTSQREICLLMAKIIDFDQNVSSWCNPYIV